MKYHVLTPFSRFENLKKLIGMLRPMGIEWHLLLDDDLPFRLHFDENWIHPCYFPSIKAPFWQVWRHSLNWNAEKIGYVDGDYYLILNDDDAYEPDFFKKLSQHTSDVLICSMKRGNRTPVGVIPERAHAFNDLIACKENLRVGGVGAEQMVIKGSVLRGHYWPDDISADGIVINYVAATHPVEFVPDAFVWFNYYEPGRWD